MAMVRRAQLICPLTEAALSPSALATGMPNQRAMRRTLGVAISAWPDSCRLSATSICPSRLASSRSLLRLSLAGQRAVRLSAPGVTVVSNATRWPRTVKLPRAPTWPLRRPVTSAWISLIVSQLPSAVVTLSVPRRRVRTSNPMARSWSTSSGAAASTSAMPKPPSAPAERLRAPDASR